MDADIVLTLLAPCNSKLLYFKTENSVNHLVVILAPPPPNKKKLTVFFFQKIFQEHYRVIRFGSRSGPTFCRSLSRSKLFANAKSRR